MDRFSRRILSNAPHPTLLRFFMTIFPRYYLRRSEYAELWGVSPTTLLRYEERGWLTPEYSDGGHRYYPAHVPPWRGRRRQARSNVRLNYSRSAVGADTGAVRGDFSEPARHARAVRNIDRPQTSRPTVQSPQRVHENAFRQFIAQLETLRGSPWITICRLDNGGSRELVTIPGALFSLQWVKQNFGGGRFEAGGVGFRIEGPPKDSRWA